MVTGWTMMDLLLLLLLLYPSDHHSRELLTCCSFNSVKVLKTSDSKTQQSESSEVFPAESFVSGACWVMTVFTCCVSSSSFLLNPAETFWLIKPWRLDLNVLFSRFWPTNKVFLTVSGNLDSRNPMSSVWVSEHLETSHTNFFRLFLVLKAFPASEHSRFSFNMFWCEVLVLFT